MATAAEHSRAKSEANRDIGDAPAVVNPRRKAKGLKSLLFFGETYFPSRFPLSVGPAHLVAIEKMESCTDRGGLFACAMPRGSGKTSWAEVAAMRAVFYGLRRFVMLIGPTDTHSQDMLESVKAEIETNDLLYEDFPEICYPVRRLDGIGHRCKGQHSNGERTRIQWGSDHIVLPTMRKSKASGTAIRTAGVTGSIRGAKIVGPNGQSVRPDMVLIDDCQTRDSAKSAMQTMDREKVIADDVLGLAGPNVAIAAVQLCTVIYPGDLSDRFLSADKHPEWQSVRTKMIEAWPVNRELWDRYAEVRKDSQRAGGCGLQATEFYRENRAAMDDGAAVSWPDRVKPGDLSALQTAMNLFIDNPKGFAAEYQNEPEPEEERVGAKRLEPAGVAERLSGLPRYEVPVEATQVTAFVDPGGGVRRGIWYSVVAWDEHFGGSVIDYGTWPRQNRKYYAASDLKPGIAEMYPGRSETEALYAGLSDLLGSILGRTYQREKGGGMKVDRCLIDCGWNAQTVYRFCRESAYASVLLPSKGIGRTTTARGVGEWKPRPGERTGYHWRITISETGRGRMVQFDPDAWKTFLFERMSTPGGGRGRVTLYGQGGPNVDHGMIAEHCAAESSVPVTIRGTTFDKWTVRAGEPDNHLWDTLVGNALAASVQGLLWSPAAGGVGKPDKPDVKYVDFGKTFRERSGAGTRG